MLIFCLECLKLWLKTLEQETIFTLVESSFLELYKSVVFILTFAFCNELYSNYQNIKINVSGPL